MSEKLMMNTEPKKLKIELSEVDNKRVEDNEKSNSIVTL